MINQVCKPHLSIYKIKLQYTEFDILSFYNMVIFYKDRLKELNSFRYAKDVFSIAEQNHLTNKMIIIPCHYKDTIKSLGTATIPSCLARMIMSGFITINRKKLIKEIEKWSNLND